MRSRALHISFFILGLLLSGMSFMVYVGNALTGEGRSDSVALAGILGMIAGSVTTAAGALMRAAARRRFAPVIVGGLVGAAAWLVGLFVFFGGRAGLEYWLAICVAPAACGWACSSADAART